MEFSFLLLWTNEFSALAGVVAGVLHHGFIQYPYQAKIFTAIHTFMLSNIIFIICLIVLKNVRPLALIKELVIFNTIYLGMYIPYRDF